ncbi:cobalt ECF transporter T component CbiQ [bacterium]|nr:MAG: cobalt ECF transporter T component CbiQ [bacterium]
MTRDSYLRIEAIARQKNIFTGMDARIKTMFALAALLLIVILQGVRLPLMVTGLGALFLFYLKAPGRVLAARFGPPLMICGLIAVADMFLMGSTPLFRIEVGNLALTGYREGLLLGLQFLARVSGSVSILVLLSLTTPVTELMKALNWFRVPRVLVEVLMLTYRYLFVFWEEGSRIREAQTMRLGYPKWTNLAGWRRVLRNTWTLSAMVLIRAYDRAEHTYQAMQVRGYRGRVLTTVHQPWSPAQTVYSVAGAFLLVLLVIVSI